MSIQKKSLVSAIKTTRKANLVKDESSDAATVSPAAKSPVRMSPAKKFTAKKFTAKKFTAKKV